MNNNLEELIGSLYDLIQDAKSVPLSADKCILERDKVLDMLDEIIAQLNEQPNKEWIDELRTLFNMSDLVKFAKYKPLINENDMNLIAAIDFVNMTKVEEVAPATPVTEEIVVKEGRSKQERTLVLCGIIVLGLCGIAALYVALSRIIHLFF